MTNIDLTMPAHLVRKPGSKSAAKIAAKPATAAKPAAPAKPLTAKQAAQLKAGVKVTTDTKAAAPAAKLVEAPKAPAAAAAAPKATAPKGKPGLPVKELVKAIRAHGKKFAHQNGWDLLIADWSDADIAKAIDGQKFKRPAIAVVRTAAQALDKKRPKDRPAPAKVKA